ncbi:uncharacterized protein LOC130692198 [Daphnia carinata]|uniref:uncharacterized protein LOC130692198 n=1 Tax=Daphnia carinata TaxID=120202 RepID=UPI0025799878|nr:uncharacterized protein LOC130692198 [Daphnia carinata]
MNRRQDSRMITEMKEQLRRLQERRQELESRQADEEEVFGQSIVPHLSRVMRDRQWAQVRCMIQRNMDSIDRDIQETIGRLGTAMLESSDPGQSPRHAHFPDLIPQTKSWAKPKEEPLHSSLPPPGDPTRRDLLEAVRKTLERRKKLLDEEEKNVQSPRVGFYQLRHESVTNQEDKLSRLSVQKLPSVTIATQKPDLPVNHVISVQSPSIVPVSAEPLVEQPNTAVDNQQPTLEPDDVARIFSDLLATQLDLAVDSIGQLTSPRQCQIKSSHHRDNNGDDEFRLTIDSCTQTAIRNVKDSSTIMERWHQTDRAVGPDLPISPESDTEEIIQVSSEEDIKEEEVEEPLTPPRASCINIVPVPSPALDLNLWRQRFPPTPPSSCLESLIRQVDVAAHETSVSTMADSSSSDATGISSSFANASSSSDTVSRLSEGEAPNHVASRGQIIVQKTGAESRKIINRSAEETLSEGQIPLDVLPNFQFTSSLIDGSSYGEVLIPQQQTSRSNSTASFQSATGSIGEIRQSSTTDELDSE